MLSGICAASGAAQCCVLYVALVYETATAIGQLENLISVVLAPVGEAASIDVRPGVAAVLHLEERQLDATTAASLASTMGRRAAPAPLAAHPRVFLRVAQRSGDGLRSDDAPGAEHALRGN